MTSAKTAPDAQTLGWREWVGLPALGATAVKAKVDTGARTSSLHAFELVEAEREGEAWIEFSFHPLQRDSAAVIRGSARLVDRRQVRPSSGLSELRPVVATDLALGGERFPIELTLTNRYAMGFRMLLGRHAIRDRFLVDPRRSYLSPESKQARRDARRRRGKRAEGEVTA